MTKYIELEALKNRFAKRLDWLKKDIHDEYSLGLHDGCEYDTKLIDEIPATDVEKMSDGYHTFADLYEQRLILSAALAKNNPHAWKSKRHEDGSVPFGGGWFIMGFDTDEGCYTYHYELKDWDLFQCKELDKGKPWDGHTSKDVRRLLSIPAAERRMIMTEKDLEIQSLRRALKLTEEMYDKQLEVNEQLYSINELLASENAALKTEIEKIGKMNNREE